MFIDLWHEVLNFYWLPNCPIWPARLQMFVIGQFGPERANEAINKGW